MVLPFARYMLTLVLLSIYSLVLYFKNNTMRFCKNLQLLILTFFEKFNFIRKGNTIAKFQFFLINLHLYNKFQRITYVYVNHDKKSINTSIMSIYSYKYLFVLKKNLTFLRKRNILKTHRYKW